MTDSEALDAIHEILDGCEWSADTLDEIAYIIRQTGRPINEPDGEE